MKLIDDLRQASSADGKDGGLEFVKPPAESQPGDRIYFEGEKYEGEISIILHLQRTKRIDQCASAESGRLCANTYLVTGQTPEAQLNPKKKIFETIQPVSDCGITTVTERPLISPVHL